MPADAQITMSTDGCVATAISPSGAADDQHAASQAIRAVGGRHRDDRRAVARHLLGEQRRVVAGGERGHAQPIGMRVDDRQRALADRAGRSENREVLHATRPWRTMK